MSAISLRYDRHRRRIAAGCAGAFTIVELLVVIGIITVLIAILLPTLGHVREQANRVNCLANLSTLGQSMTMYAQSFQDRLPNGNPPNQSSSYTGTNQVLVDFAGSFVKAAGVFHCPSDRDPAPTSIDTADYTLPNSARVSYDFYSVFWVSQLGPILTRLHGQAPLVWDLNGGGPSSSPEVNQNHGTSGGNVLFSDGHAEWQAINLWDGPDWPHPGNQYYDQH